MAGTTCQRTSLLLLVMLALLASRASGQQTTSPDPKAAALAALRAIMTPTAAGNLLRLAFHDVGTFVKANQTGGANGSIRFEFNAPPNSGLAFGIQFLQQVQARLIAQGVTVSWADLVQLAGAAAVESSGGPKIDIIMGRKDASVADPNLERELPKETADAPTLKSMFAAKGFTPQEMVALSGAHSIGASQVAQPIGPMTPTPTVFGNHYYKFLLSGGGAFPSDRTLLTDSETATWVRTEV